MQPEEREFIVKAEAAIAMAKRGELTPRQLLAYLKKLCGQFQSFLSDLAFIQPGETVDDIRRRAADLNAPADDWDAETDRKYRAPSEGEAPIGLADF